MGVFANIRNDLAYARGLTRALRLVIPLARRKERTLPIVAEELARRFGERPALISDRETLTYAGLNARANQYARWALAAGVARGDVICLLMPNRPEFVAAWLGIGRAGGVTALLNTHLTGAALAHCINIVRPKHIIVAAPLAEAFASAEPLVAGAFTRWDHGGEAGGPRRVDAIVDSLDGGPIPADELPKLTHEDRCLHIYTSGTTGLPKAANINHYRVLAAMYAFSAVTEATAGDRMYDCLPLYHTVGGACALGPLIVGGSVFIAERFSAHNFWDDVVAHDCTLFQYIGELCRYLLNAPPHPKEAHHRIRLCCGNGLRPDVWTDFHERFAIPEIREFYAATEGNAVMFNFDNTPGAVGRVPWWAKTIFPITNVRFDLERETPVRGADGLCIECLPEETGEVVAEIVFNPMKPGQRFDGYADQRDTERKILRDVLKKGDSWFRTGDLMRRDRRGYYYFLDRIGDTFRWKGENVSTSQVAEAIGTLDGVMEANVYGVAVAGADGRAGMAALVVAAGLDLGELRRHIHDCLPHFARPVFLRMQATIHTTSTFKQRKIGLVAEGFDPDRIADPIWLDDAAAGAYVRLDAALYQRIQSGAVRL